MTEEGQEPDKVQTPKPETKEQPKPETENADAQPESNQPITSEVFPDTPPLEKDDAKLQSLEAEKTELNDKLKAVSTENETLASRLKENQEYISRTRKAEQPKAETPQPKRNFNEYLDDRLKKFEDDPKEGFRQFMTDVAFDRDLEHQDYEKRIANAETSSLRHMLKLDPEKAKVMESLDKLEQERPDLSKLTFDQKLEWVRMKETSSNQQQPNNESIAREKSLAGDIGGGSGGRKPDKLPSWTSDPRVMDEARGRFGSKKEMVDWQNADYESAMRLIKK